MGDVVFPRWRKKSSVPPLPDEWLISLLDYRFYKAGQQVSLPAMDSVIISFEDGDEYGTVMSDTLFDEEGCVILPDHEVRWLNKQILWSKGGELG